MTYLRVKDPNELKLNDAKTRDSAGFTLMEVAFALMIFSLISIPYFHLQFMKKKDAEFDQTNGNINTVKVALRKYALDTGAYPLPANRALGPGEDGFGKQAVPGAALDCLSAVDGEVCFTAGVRDSDGDTNLERVLIGAVPFADLGLPPEYMMDGYGAKLTYAVTEILTTPAFNDSFGAILIEDATGNARMGSTDGLGVPIVHYVVFSHGADSAGGYGLEGMLLRPCDTVVQPVDAENCDEDGIFNDNYDTIQDPYDDTGLLSVYARLEAGVSGVNHYDDFVGFAIATTGNLWSRQANTDDIFLRADNVLIGDPAAVPLPVTRLDVVGNVSTEELRVNRLCPPGGCPCDQPGIQLDPAKPDCAAGLLPADVFNPKIIAAVPVAGVPGNGVFCGNNGPLTGVSHADEECSKAGLLSTVDIGGCGPGFFPTGTNAAGQLNCVIP